MSKIELIDTTIRDGNQSLWGATGITNAMAIQIAPVVNEVGFRALDFVTSTALGVAVRYHKENPWDRIRLFHERAPNVKLGFLGSPMRFISWQKVSDSVMQLAFRLLVRNGISRFQIIDPMNDMDSLLAVAKMAREEGVEEVVGGLTYTVSPVHDDPYYIRCAQKLEASPSLDRFYLKDPGGLLAPERTQALVRSLRRAFRDRPLEIHSHCSLGLAPLSYLEAAKAGISAIHVAADPVGNGSSHPPATLMVSNLRALGHTVDIDDDALAAMCSYFRELALAEGLPIGEPQNFDAAALDHQVPGGMLTTMMRQLREMNQLHELPAVLKEVAVVRRDLGYPIMVTPFSQVVAAQAVMNVLSDQRYKNVPDEVIRYALGRFGSSPFPIDANVLDRILDRKRAKELDEESGMPEVPELRRKFGNIPEEELLLRAVMPEGQVDAMLAAGPTRTCYEPSVRPLKRLLRELAQRRDLGQIQIHKPDFQLQLVRDQI